MGGRVKLVASNNSFVFDELGRDSFRLVNTEAIVVASGDEALAAVQTHRPDLLVIDGNLPGIDGYQVCERVKADPELKLVRVIILMHGSITTPELKRLARCGCDDVMLYQEPGETLYRHAARLLGLPDRSLARPVMLRAVIADQSREIHAQATGLSTTEVFDDTAFRYFAFLHPEHAC